MGLPLAANSISLP